MNQNEATLEALRIDRRARAPQTWRPWRWLVGLVLLAGVAAAAWWWVQPKAALVRTTLAREVSGPSADRTVLNGSGYVVARREATVSSKVTGKVITVLIEEGMRVAEGQIVARLDATNTETNLRLAEAQLDAAKSALAEIRVRLEEAEKERHRIVRLREEGIATEAELDRAEAEARAAQARRERQTADVTVAERQVAVWRQQLEDTIIRAPFAGIVVAKNAQPGEMISPISAGGGFTRTGIGTIVDMDSLEIEVEVSESYINRVEPKQAVEATLDAYPDWRIPCGVIAIIPTADRQKATVKVRVGFDQLDPRILPQMGVKVAFRGGAEPAGAQASGGVLVARQAVRQADGRATVFVVKNGRVERRAVRTGPTRGEDLEILAGIIRGEKLVVEGPATLKDGDPVKERAHE